MALSQRQLERLVTALQVRVTWPIRIISQRVEPPVRNQEILIWQDTSNNTTKILMNQGGTAILFRPTNDIVSVVDSITTLTAATAGGTYGATEQTMLQEAHDTARQLLAAFKGFRNV